MHHVLPIMQNAAKSWHLQTCDNRPSCSNCNVFGLFDFCLQAVAAQINLADDYVYYFGLFLIKKEDVGENSSKWVLFNLYITVVISSVVIEEYLAFISM